MIKKLFLCFFLLLFIFGCQSKVILTRTISKPQIQVSAQQQNTTVTVLKGKIIIPKEAIGLKTQAQSPSINVSKFSFSIDGNPISSANILISNQTIEQNGDISADYAISGLLSSQNSFLKAVYGNIELMAYIPEIKENQVTQGVISVETTAVALIKKQLPELSVSEIQDLSQFQSLIAQLKESIKENTGPVLEDSGVGKIVDSVVSAVPSPYSPGPTPQIGGHSSPSPLVLIPAVASSSPPGPQITTFSPDNAAYGVTVIIEGLNFDSVASNNTVKFNGITAVVKISTPTQLLVEVPDGDATGKITVATQWGSDMSTQKFTLYQPSSGGPSSPVILSFNPQEGIVGDTITVTGQHLAGVKKVFLGDVEAEFVQINSEQFTFIVSDTSVDSQIKVETNHGNTISNDIFIVKPNIDWVVEEGYPGDMLQIIGTAFSSNPAENVIQFGAQTPVSITPDYWQMQFEVPLGLLPGVYEISVTVNGKKSNTKNFRILRRIIFTSNRDGNFELYSMKSNGTDVVRLTNNPADDRYGSFFQSGTKILFNTSRDGNYQIYSMNIDGTNVQRITNNPFDDMCSVVFPDDSKMIFEKDIGNYEIYKSNIDGTNEINITNNLGSDLWPTRSSDGAKIAFETNRDGNYEIYTMNNDGSNPTNITNTPTADRHPSWSPNGTKIAFESYMDGNSEIYVMNIDGTNPINLTNQGTSDQYPRWSEDGSKILFQSNRHGNWEVYMMNADGTFVRRLTTNPAMDLYPIW